MTIRNRRFLTILLLAAVFSVVPSRLRCALAQTSEPIVGGVEAAPGAWPFQAALMNSALDQFCGGSLIAPQWILTAAHCAVDDNGFALAPSYFRVGMGLHSLSAGGGTIYTVTEVHVHPSFNNDTLNNDFALLKLSTPASQSPVLLNFSSTSLVGLNATVTGWGTTRSGASSGSDVLLQVTVPIVSNAVCSPAYPDLTNNMLCAGFSAGGKDSCEGDSGGPLFIENGSTVTQVGVVSFGNGCGLANNYGVYSRVSSAESFIRTYVNIQALSSVTGKYGLWNGFLKMVNIIELINHDSQAVNAQVNLFATDGTLVSSNTVAVGASSQQDVIVNSLPGFRADFYGIIQVSNNVEGRMTYYRPTATAFTDFDFVFGVPLSAPITGDSRVAFNTYQPSFDPADQGLLVANWLSIVNLSGSAQSFTVKKYDSAGGLLSSVGYPVSAKSRLDIEGGHQSPGPSNVGLIEIQPSDGSAGYLAQLMRYGYGPAGGFEFAFPLIAAAGTGSAQAIPLGSRYTAQNWLEVVNAGSIDDTVDVKLYNQAGALLDAPSLQLPAHSQHHIDVNAVLGAGAIGSAVVSSQGGRPVVAQSMIYYRSTDGSIGSMYGSQARAANGSSATGSFNLFLSMENYLKIVNPNSSSANYDVTISSLFSAGSSQTVNIPAHSSVELDLHDTATYGTAVNSYGSVIVQPVSPSLPSIEEVLRLKHTTATEVQFAAPTGFE